MVNHIFSAYFAHYGGEQGKRDYPYNEFFVTIFLTAPFGPNDRDHQK